MGSTFMTKAAAAKELGVSVRNIFYKIQHGILRPVKQGRYVGVFAEDVIALKEQQFTEIKERTPQIVINKQSMLRLDNELRILRQEMDQVLRVLNIRREALKASDMEMVALYQTASKYGVDGWPPQVEETWANYFLRLHIENLQQLEKVTKDDHPWRPFLKLSRAMALKPYNTELSIQLVSAREHVQSMSSVWLEMKRISPLRVETLLMKDAAPSKRMMGVIARRQDKFAEKNGSPK